MLANRGRLCCFCMDSADMPAIFQISVEQHNTHYVEFLSNFKVKFFPHHFTFFPSSSVRIKRAFLIKTWPSKGSWAVSILFKCKLKMHHQTQDTNFFVLMYSVKKSRFNLLKWHFKTAISSSGWFFSSFLSVKAVGEESGRSQRTLRVNLPSFKGVWK